jgi:penicillin amidase
VRWATRIGLLIALSIMGAALFAYWTYQRQGLDPEELVHPGATITLDDRGIPTIEAEDYETLLEAQGFVTASERLFQMDLYRRAGSGRLAELFGPGVVPLDRTRREEDWLGTAVRAVTELDLASRAQLEAYARGVNRFINEHPDRWGIEYPILRTAPEVWQPHDSVLVLLQMCDQLATTARSEAETELWRQKLPPDWFAFLFPEDHPWNEPMFGGRGRPGPELPSKALAPGPVRTGELRSIERRSTAGSNSWAWCGGTGCFLANDPHLGHTVPALWYAVRLRQSATKWVAGVSIPGLPGVVLGMNPHLAWAFTNVGEDVDDYLLEEVDGDRYVASVEDGQKTWRPIEERPYDIQVRGADPIRGVARFTHRGPLGPRDGLDGLYSRQWLPLKAGMIRYASRLTEAKSWDELNGALDDMAVPAQNVLMVDRDGNIGYRASGTGIVRRVTGRRPQPALEGEWIGFQDRSTRPRKLLARTSTAPTFIGTANQRIWVDEFSHRWAEDLRHHRIREVLSSRTDFQPADMRALQLDTKSELHRRILSFLASNATGEDELRARWSGWDGVAATSPETFTDALEAERLLLETCIGRVRAAYGIPEGAKYAARLDSAWVLTVLERGSLDVFGLDTAEAATEIVRRVAGAPRTPYTIENRWQAQHPFVGRVPLLGDRFRVDERPQVGHVSLVRSEAPKFGASTRLLWNLSSPLESTWALPVGQSGHLRSPHYRDLQADWFADRPMKVLDPRFTWER